jgi:NAD(P)-dependent dehydrogenase (short-subunit alcohol dehydrogenase family)
MTLLREQLLAGRTVALDGEALDLVESLLEGLGAQVELVSGSGSGSGSSEELEGWVREVSPVDALAVFCGGSFADGGPGGLQLALERAWTVVQAVVTGAMIERGGGGKIVFVAPRAGAGELAGAAAAGLENLARTLSVEWARYRITTSAIVPGASATDEEIADLVGFLVSSAGDYFSGCRFDLRA